MITFQGLVDGILTPDQKTECITFRDLLAFLMKATYNTYYYPHCNKTFKNYDSAQKAGC